jgi:hypothetical protein
MPKTQTKPGLSPRELDALRRQYLDEWASWKKQRDSASRWQLANDIASGINDIVGRGVIAPILGAPADIGDLLWNAGAWVNNKIKDVEYATGMVKPDLSSLVTGQRKGYIPYSQGNAYLGSEDIGNRMERAGLVSPKRRPMTELAASFVSPSAVAKTAINAPKTAMNMLRMAENLEAPSRGVRTADGMYIPRGQMGAIENLYHGSPHTFDRFDLSKIGTGEGAQAYGYGAYLAESPDVAHGYQYSTQTPEILIKGDSWKSDQSGVYRNPDGMHEGYLDDVSYSAIRALAGSRPDKSLAEIAGDAERFLLRRGEPQANIDSVKKAILSGDISLVKNDGNIYQTRLAWPDAAREAADPLSPDHFLHWDKPLSEQPKKVRDALRHEKENTYSAGAVYGTIAKRLGGEDLASEYIKRLGIPGIRYLDAGSRPTNVVDKRLYALYEKYGDVNKAVDEMMKGVYNTPKVKQQMRDGYIKQLNTQKQTSNYVVFDDKMIDIVSRNNQPIKK